jgi:protocatechuate 3,4-dioxygenase beta subunit
MRSALLALCRDAENSATSHALRRGRSRKGVGHWAFAALVGCVALFALAPVAVAAGTGSIEGTVTESAHKALEKATVTVYSESEEVEGTTSTNASGEYTVSGLSGGHYKVGFSDQPTYANQYYNKQSSFGGASLVSVTEGSATSGIDAEMLQPGKITGRVTSSSGVPIANVSVDIYDSGFDFEPNRFAATNANGEYTIEGLQEGEYKVAFFPENSAYLPQYYNGQTTLASSNPVLVTAGGVASGINATLIEGGKISGIITDAYSHARLAKIRVGASASGNGEGGYGSAETNANGEYTITGLPTGSYKVGFYWEYSEAEYKACAHAPRCPPKYITQYFNNQPSEATANSVAAAVGAVTSGVNAAMVPSAPFNTAAPGVSGTATVGGLLSCSSGSWTGEPELALSAGWPLTSPFSYQWLRDGVPIAGATSPAYTVQATDVGHALVCEVTATNVAGHTAARSAAVAVVLPAVTLSSSKIAVSGGSAHVPIVCANATCKGTIELTGQVAVKSKGKKAKSKTVTLAKGSYSLAAGKKATISVRLTSAGKSALAAAKAHRLSGKAGVTVTSGATVKKSVVLSEAATKGKRK